MHTNLFPDKGLEWGKGSAKPQNRLSLFFSYWYLKKKKKEEAIFTYVKTFRVIRIQSQEKTFHGNFKIDTTAVSATNEEKENEKKFLRRIKAFKN